MTRPGSTGLSCGVTPVPRQHRHAGHPSAGTGATPASPPAPTGGRYDPQREARSQRGTGPSAVPSDAGAGDPGPPTAPCSADLPLPACRGCPCQRRRPDPQRCRAALSGSLSASLSAAPPPASPGWEQSLELPVLARRRETSPVRGRSWAEAPHGETGSEWHRDLVEDKPKRGCGRWYRASLLAERLMRGLRK